MTFLPEALTMLLKRLAKDELSQRRGLLLLLFGRKMEGFCYIVSGNPAEICLLKVRN